MDLSKAFDSRNHELLTAKAYSKNLGQRSILARKGTFFEKMAPMITSLLIPYY